MTWVRARLFDQSSTVLNSNQVSQQGFIQSHDSSNRTLKYCIALLMSNFPKYLNTI